jgi:hypothetical protein
VQNHKGEIKLFYNQNFTDILLISETHFTKNYFIIAKYILCNTIHLDGTAHGGTVVLKKETIENYVLLKYGEDSIQAT